MVGDVSALALLSDDEDIERYIAALPANEVAACLYIVSETRRRLYQAERMLKSRIVAEQILSSAEVWTSPDGRDFMWVGDRERVCSDPAALREQLSELPLSVVAKAALVRAFKEMPLKVYLTEIDKIEQWGGPEASRIIRSFIYWKEGSPKLRSLDEDGR